MSFLKLITIALFSAELCADDYQMVLDSHQQKIKEIPIRSWSYVKDFRFVDFNASKLSVFYMNQDYLDANDEIQETIQNSLCRENAMRLYQFRLPTKTTCLFVPDINDSRYFFLLEE